MKHELYWWTKFPHSSSVHNWSLLPEYLAAPLHHIPTFSFLLFIRMPYQVIRLVSNIYWYCWLLVPGFKTRPELAERYFPVRTAIKLCLPGLPSFPSEEFFPCPLSLVLDILKLSSVEKDLLFDLILLDLTFPQQVWEHFIATISPLLFYPCDRHRCRTQADLESRPSSSRRWTQNFNSLKSLH